MNRPPGLPGTKPVVGHVLSFRKDPLSFFIRSHEQLGDLAWLQSPRRKVVILFKPDYIRYVLQGNHKSFTKSFGYDELQILLGEGLLTSEGEKWMKQRRLAQPAFHKERLMHLVKIMGDVARDTKEQWLVKYKNGDEVNITFEMSQLALEMVSRTLFQTDISAAEIDDLNQSLAIVIAVGARRIRDPFYPPRWVPTKLNRDCDKAVKRIHAIVGGIIKRRMESAERFDDMLDMLIHTVDEETGEKMDAVALMDEVMTIFIAGHETTANALAFTWYLLATNPNEKQKFLEELIHLDTDVPEPKHLRELKYNRMVIDESLRLYPPAWIMGRKGIHAEELGGYSLPKGCTYGIPVYVIHRSKSLWNDPDKFIPERFSEENISSIPKFGYFPFGGGPRLCIGQMFALYEMQIALHTLWKTFDFTLKDNYQLEIEPLITLRTKTPVVMNLTIRDSSI